MKDQSLKSSHTEKITIQGRSVNLSNRSRDIEAEVVPGLEDMAQVEIARLGADVRVLRPGLLACRYTGPLEKLLRLRLVVAVYVLRFFNVPRPKALLGHEHFTALLDMMREVSGLPGVAGFKTLRIGAAGEESGVLSRLRSELAAQTKLQPVTEEGDMLLRLRRVGSGWEAALRITPRPLSARSWRVCNMPGALNATVAAAMIDMTRPTPSDVFLNLGSGSGTLLVERMAGSSARLAFGVDLSPDAIDCARSNLKAAKLEARAHLLRTNATAMPLPDASCDVLVADLPFGQIVGSHAENEALYPALLAEAGRVARPGARMALISHEIRLLERTVTASPRWSVESSRRITLPFKAGGINPVVYLLIKR